MLSLLVGSVSYGQNLSIKKIKGNWLSESVCIIATRPDEITPSNPIDTITPVFVTSINQSPGPKTKSIPQSTTSNRWQIDNYHFKINIIKFLWIRRYQLQSTNGNIFYSVAKGNYSYDEANKEITIRKMWMKPHECDALTYRDIITYSVVMVNDSLMIWVPRDTQDFSTEYLESIHWRK